MIKKFEHFDIDPYGEENWEDKPKKDETKYWLGGQFLPRSEIIDIIRDRAVDFFERHPFRTDFYMSGIMFHRSEFDLNESVSDIDPYGEENWEDKKVFADFPEGNYHIEMLADYDISLEYGYYDDEDVYVEEYTNTLELYEGDDIWIDVIENDESNVYVTIDTGDEHVGRGTLPKNVFILLW